MKKDETVLRCYMCGKRLGDKGSYVVAYDMIYCLFCAKHLNLIK